MREVWEKELDEDPCNWGVRLIYADWLDEQGDADTEEALLQRYFGTYKKAPIYSGSSDQKSGYGYPRAWRFYWEEFRPVSHYVLPIPYMKFQTIKDYESDTYGFVTNKHWRSRKEAEQRVKPILLEIIKERNLL